MPLIAGPARAADSVHVVLSLIGEIQVHHMGQLLDINPTGSDVGGHQHPHLTALKS